jgi:hypothetical protein
VRTSGSGQARRKIARLDASSLVVDMGCGTGSYRLGIQARTGCTVVGFDEHRDAEAARKTPDFPIVQAVGDIPYRGIATCERRSPRARRSNSGEEMRTVLRKWDQIPIQSVR